MKRRVTGVLVAVNALLVCLLAWLWIDPQGGLRGVHWEPPSAIKPDLGSPSLASLVREDADNGRFVAIMDRPLFYPGRRPGPVSKAGTGTRTDPLDSVHLFGLFTGSEGGGAIVQVEGKTRRLKLSEALGDWTLKEIRPREVVFARGGESRVVPLVQAKQGGAAAPGAPPAGALPSFQFPFPTPGASPFFTPQGNAPATSPARIDSATPPSAGNAPAPAPSNAKPAPSASPFVTGGSR